MSILRTPNGWRLANGRPLIVATGAAAATTSLTLSAYPVANTRANPVFQRKAGTESNPDGGYGDAPILYTFTGGAPTVEARIVDMDNPTIEIKGWTELLNPQVDGSGQVVATLPQVPIGMDYKTEIRVKGQPSVNSTASMQRWGMGVCIVLTGQSNMLGMLYDNLVYNRPVPGYSPTTGENDYWLTSEWPGVYFGVDGYSGSSWYGLSNTGSDRIMGNNGTLSSASGHLLAFIRQVGKGLRTKHSRKIPVCVNVWAFNGMGLPGLTPYQEPNTVFTYSGTTVGVANGSIGFHSPKGFGPGDYEMILLHQGEAASGSMGSDNNTPNPSQTRANRVIDLEAFYDAHLTVLSGIRTANNLTFLPAVLGSYTAFPFVEDIRGALHDFIKVRAPARGWNKVFFGWSCADIDAADEGPGVDPLTTQGMHFTNVNGGNYYKKWCTSRAVQSVLYRLGCATFDGMGPKVNDSTMIVEGGIKVITGATTRNINNVTVSMIANGGNLVVRNPALPVTGWYAHTRADFDDAQGPSITLPAGSVTVSNGQPVIAFPAGTQFPCYLKHLGGKPGTMQSKRPDSTNPLVNDVVYPTGTVGTDVISNGIPVQNTPDPIKVT